MVGNRVPFAEGATIGLFEALVVLITRPTIFLTLLLIHLWLHTRHCHNILLIQRKLLYALDDFTIELGFVVLVQLAGLVV